MPTLEELKKTRLAKLTKLEKGGVLAFPISTKRNVSITDVLKNFKKFLANEKEIIIAGRIMNLRAHGGAVFFDIRDGSEKIQVLVKKDRVGDSAFKFFRDVFDIGDFIEVRGTAIETKTKEKTILANNFKMLAKSLLPLPEKWHGLQDIEERYRKRYLDLLFNEKVKENFEIRSKIISCLRQFMEKQGFLEVETPMLQPIYGGARAKPFKTHLNALDMDLYLRIAPELYLKRLIVGGFNKVYEIGRCFRNEGMDKSHNPEFTSFEFYWAYADYKDLMKLTEQMFEYILTSLRGKFTLNVVERKQSRDTNFSHFVIASGAKQSRSSFIIEYQGQKINFIPPWERIEFNDILQKFTKIDFGSISQKKLLEKAKELGVKVEKAMLKAEIADEIYKKYCREKIIQPTFVIHQPLGFQPLAKALEKEPNKLASFQLVAGGIELVNAFSELNDPQEQEKRFKEQESLFKQGIDEAQRMDKDFIEALEYGMPPCAGFGMGIDRLSILLTNSHALREIILFPTMRPKIT